MSMTDPISDMVTRVRNAFRVRKSEVLVPASTLKTRIAEILQEEGFIDGFSKDEQGNLVLRLRYDGKNQSVIQEIRRMSKPGQRHYVQTHNIQKVRSGLGIAILSTSKGVMSDRKARSLGVGGELLCEVW